MVLLLLLLLLVLGVESPPVESSEAGTPWTLIQLIKAMRRRFRSLSKEEEEEEGDTDAGERAGTNCADADADGERGAAMDIYKTIDRERDFLVYTCGLLLDGLVDEIIRRR